MAQTKTIPTRRSFLSAAVVAAVVPAGALAQTDPIFAAIERHRMVYKEFGAASLVCNEKSLKA
jgi:hypothetical protein